jgi:hypothetical protein
MGRRKFSFLVRAVFQVIQITLLPKKKMFSFVLAVVLAVMISWWLGHDVWDFLLRHCAEPRQCTAHPCICCINVLFNVAIVCLAFSCISPSFLTSKGVVWSTIISTGDRLFIQFCLAGICFLWIMLMTILAACADRFGAELRIMVGRLAGFLAIKVVAYTLGSLVTIAIFSLALTVLPVHAAVQVAGTLCVPAVWMFKFWRSMQLRQVSTRHTMFPIVAILCIAFLSLMPAPQFTVLYAFMLLWMLDIVVAGIIVFFEYGGRKTAFSVVFETVVVVWAARRGVGGARLLAWSDAVNRRWQQRPLPRQPPYSDEEDAEVLPCCWTLLFKLVLATHSARIRDLPPSPTVDFVISTLRCRPGALALLVSHAKSTGEWGVLQAHGRLSPEKTDVLWSAVRHGDGLVVEGMLDIMHDPEGAWILGSLAQKVCFSVIVGDEEEEENEDWAALLPLPWHQVQALGPLVRRFGGGTVHSHRQYVQAVQAAVYWSPARSAWCHATLRAILAQKNELNPIVN